MKKITSFFGLVFAALNCLGQDLPLSGVLIPGEEWKVVAEGYGFTDAACADAEGNFYFSDVSKGQSIFKIDNQGKISDFVRNAPKISGLKFGADGKLYACQNGAKKVVSFEIPSGQMRVLAENVDPNDLVVTRKGYIYFTETSKKQVTLITPGGEVKAADTGIGKPNGIALSPDETTLAVSDYGGTNVWVMRIETDGSLKFKEPYMTARTAPGKSDASLDGMTTDTVGRYYVTTSLGVQIFDPTGRISGIILRPQNKSMVSAVFSGPGLHYLYVACGDKIYRRKTQAQGWVVTESQ
ncbi:MAG: SMP-30/Gluconolaconase/LRE domain protein [Verrucomicrobiales bacterium]|nr:SMP-30/Gluconolaconase/LRE domain protein [Verrucomicrobiales bacterium]